MPKRSAGVLLFRRTGAGPEVLLVHPGGPFWARRDVAAWSIPKGECEPGEEPLAAAQREFAEETGLVLQGPFMPLGDFRQASGKVVSAWACEGGFDPARLVSVTFAMEWPPRSGRMQDFPEVDRAGWFTLEAAEAKIHKGQQPVLAALRDRLGGGAPRSEPEPSA